MIADAPLVWLAPDSPQGASARVPSDEAKRALGEWARARGVSVVEATLDPPRAITVDLTTADRVEQEIARARDAIATQDVDAAERALARAESELALHPELPQAAWLLAEVHRGWAARYAKIAPTDDERAERAWSRAAGLDGGRAAGVGEPRLDARAPLVKSTLDVASEEPVTVVIDGVLSAESARGASAISKSEGTHQVVILRGDDTVWAAWVAFAEGITIHVALPGVRACSVQDLARAKRVIASGIESVDARGVRCERWIAAMPAASPALVRVASCEGSRCDAFVVLGARKVIGPDNPPFIPETKWPTWATWTIVGAAAAIAVGVTLVAAGVFEAQKTETRFTNGGAKTQRAIGSAPHRFVTIVKLRCASFRRIAIVTARAYAP